MERHQGNPQDHRAVSNRILRRLVAAAGAAILIAAAAPVPAAECPAYAAGPPRNHDGSGRFFVGREIAPVMGHLGAAWLERPEREAEEKPSILIRELGLKAGDTVADIGAGTGYFSFRIAPLIGNGTVLAVDVQPEMLAMIRARARTTGIANVEPVQGRPDNPSLPDASADLILMVDVYHEFSQPCEMMRAVARALKQGGRVALIEYRAEDPGVPIKPLHKMTQVQAIREMAVAGLRWQRTVDLLPWQHLMFFTRP